MLNLTRKEIESVIKSIIILLLLVVGGIYFYQQSTNENKLLIENNEVVKGIVTELKYTKRGKMIKYSFVVKGNTYKDGRSTNIDTKVGDSVNVIYYPYNPNINRILEDFDKK